jgi:IS605 OrfB family transposase
MKIIRSYTTLIDGNVGKTDFIRQQLRVMTNISSYIFDNLKDTKFVIKEIYKNCRSEFPVVNSKLIQNFIRFSYVNAKKKPKKPVKPSLIIDYQSFNFLIDPRTKFSSIWLRFSRMNFPLRGKYILKKIQNPNDVKLVQIYEKNDKLYCKLTCSIELQDNSSSRSNPVGLDVNSKYLVLSNNRFYSLKRLYHRKIEHFKNKKDIRNLTKDYAHKLSTRIVSDLSKNGQEVLVLEDLRNIRRNCSKKLGTSKGKRVNFIVNSLPFRMFQNFLEYKCKCSGIVVKYVPPAYTSKACSACGSLDTERPRQNKFICKSCGLTLHADLNASRNIVSCYTPNQCATSESRALLDV